MANKTLQLLGTVLWSLGRFLFWCATVAVVFTVIAGAFIVIANFISGEDNYDLVQRDVIPFLEGRMSVDANVFVTYNEEEHVLTVHFLNMDADSRGFLIAPFDFERNFRLYALNGLKWRIFVEEKLGANGMIYGHYILAPPELSEKVRQRLGIRPATQPSPN